MFLASGHYRRHQVTTPQTRTIAVEEKQVPDIGGNEPLIKSNAQPST